VTKSIEIQVSGDQTKIIEIELFDALVGWEMQRRFVEFAASRDGQYRRAYTLEVLRYAKVRNGDKQIPLTTDALIDNHLQSWQNVEKVFQGILLANGIDPKTHANNPDYWVQAGAEMAIAFVAEAIKLMGPALVAIDQSKEAQPKE